MSTGNLIHGMAARGSKRSKEYAAWDHMKQRCNNPNNHAFKNYGGRGIKVCDRWTESFENFFEDMGKAPSSKHSLDRFPDNDGNYEPTNCRWATTKEQTLNRRVENRIINGKTTSELSHELGGHRNLVDKRLRMGWPIEFAISEPPNPSKRLKWKTAEDAIITER